MDQGTYIKRSWIQTLGIEKILIRRPLPLLRTFVESDWINPVLDNKSQTKFDFILRKGFIIPVSD